MKPTDIINDLRYFEGTYPKEAVLKALAQSGEIVPELKRVVQQTIENSMDVFDRADYKLCLHSIYILAQLRETSAYPLIVEMLSLPNGRSLEIVGDMFIEDIGRILASVSNGDLAPLKQLVENQEISELIRASVIGAFLVLVREKAVSRNDVISYFRELFNQKLEKRASVVWDCLVDACLDIHPGDLYDEIDQAYDQGLVDMDVVDQEKLFEAMDLDKTDVMKKFRENTIYVYISNVIAELEEMAAMLEDEEEIEFK